MPMQAGERAQRSTELRCDKCQRRVTVDEGERVPQCPECGNSSFENI